MQRQPNLFRIVLLFAIGWQSLNAAHAEPSAISESTLNEAASPLRYRRVFLEEKQLGQLAPKQRLLPIDRVKFATLLQAAQSESANQLQSPRINSAEYQSRLLPDNTLQGVADYQIAYSGHEVSLLMLSPHSLSIKSAHWIDTDGKRTEAEWGTFNWNSTPIKAAQAVKITHPGLLRITWSAAPLLQDSAELQFSFKLPQSPKSTWKFDLPSKSNPSMKGGVLLKKEPTTLGEKHYEFALNGSSDMEIRIRTSQPEKQDTSNHVCRMETTYTISKRGIDLSSVLQLQRQSAFLKEIELTLDAECKIYHVLTNGKPAEWSVSRSKKNGPSLVSIALPRDSHERVRLEINGLADTPLGELFTLPSVQPKSTEVLRNSVSVRLAPSLSVERLDAVGAMQMPTNEMSNNVGADSINKTKFQVFQFEKQSPDAAIRFKLSASLTGTTYNLTSAIFIGSKETNGTIVLQLPQEKQAKRLLRCRLAKNWIVDSIETNVPDGVSDWQQTGGDNLMILLNPDVAVRTKTIVIHARPYQTNQRGIFTSDALLPIQQIEGSVLKQTVYVHSAAGLGLVRIATENQSEESEEKQENARLQALKLSVALQNLLNLSGKNHYQPLALGVDEKWRIVRRKQAVQANLLTKVLVEPSGIRKTATDANLSRVQQFLQVECIPQGASLREVTVELSGTGASEIAWRLVGSDEPFEAESSRIVSVPGDLRERVRWVLRLDKARSTPFLIEGQITKPLTATTEVILASIQNTLKQTGRVQIDARPANAVIVLPVGLSALRISPIDSNTITKRITEFKYDPTHDVGIYANAAVRIAPSSNTKTQALAIISACELSSFITRSGLKRHVVRCTLENLGEERFTCSLPTGAVATAISVDGEQLALASLPNTPRQLSITLPNEIRFPIVKIEYQNNTELLGWIKEVRPQPPRFSLPVLKWSWKLWLPPNYTTECAQSSSKFGGRSMVHVFLGPLAIIHQPPLDRSPEQVNFLHQGWVQGKTGIDKNVVVVHRTTIFGLVVLFFLGGSALASSCWMQHFSLRILLLGMAGLAALLLPWVYAPCGTAVFVGAVLAWLLQGFAAGGRLFLGLRNRFHQRVLSPRKKAATKTLTLSLFILASSFALFIAAANNAEETSLPQLLQDSPLKTPVIPQRTNNKNQSITPKSNSANKKETNTQAEIGSEKTSNAKQSQLHVVYIPTDKNRKPVGEKVYLSETFYTELLKRVNQNAKPFGDWILQKALYSGSLTHESPNGSDSNWRLRYELETFAQKTTVFLPLHRSDAEWEPFASLDGDPIPVRWSKDGIGCIVVVDEPGKYQLTFRCTPKTLPKGQNASIQLRIPRISNATLVLTKSKNGGKDVETENYRTLSIQGATERVEGDDKLQARLQNTNRLHVQWKVENNNDTNNLPTIDRRQYMKVDSSGVLLFVQLKVIPTAKSLSHLTLELPNGAEDIEWHIQNATVETAGESQRNLHTVQFNTPIEKPTILQVQFRLPKGISIGKLTVPYVRILHAKVLANSWGIFTAADWACTVSRGDKKIVTDPLLFMAGFRVAETEENLFSHPQIAFNTSEPETPVSCTIWPKTPILSVKETMSVTLREERVNLLYRVEGKTEQGSLMQLRLRIPKEGSIDFVHLFQAGIPITTKFLANDRSGLLTICLAKPLTGRFNLECQIKAPLSFGKRWRVPHVVCLADKYEASILSLWRHSSVLVTIDQQANLTPIEYASDLKTDRPKAYPFAYYTYDHQTPYELKLLAETNHPRAEAIVVSQLTRLDDVWKAEQSTSIETKSGRLDAVTLQVQDVWASDTELHLSNGGEKYRSASRSPSTKGMMNWTLRKSTNQNKKITPKNQNNNQELKRVSQQTNDIATTENPPWRIKLQGQLRTGQDHTIDIPRVRLTEVPNLRHYITLPKAYFNLGRPWIIEGAIATNRPDGLHNLLKKPNSNWAWYRVVSPTIRLVLPSSETVQSPSIKYAEVKVYQQRDHVYFDGTFYITTESFPRLELQLQKGATLTYVEASGIAIPVERTSINAWRAAHTVSFPPGPKFVRLLYKIPREISSSDEPVLCHMPIFYAQSKAIPILQTSWSIYPEHETQVTASNESPKHLRSASSSLFMPSNAIIPRKATQKRWLALFALFLESASLQNDMSVESKSAWFTAWADLLAPVHLATLHQNSKPNTNDSGTEIDNISEAVEESGINWRKWLAENKMEASFRSALERATLRQNAAGDPQLNIAHYWFEPSADKLKLSFSPTRSTRTQRTTAVVIFLLVLGAMLPLKNFSNALPQLRCYRCIAGLLAGLMWWIWFPPWWIGFLIVLGSIITFAASRSGCTDRSEQRIQQEKG